MVDKQLHKYHHNSALVAFQNSALTTFPTSLLLREELLIGLRSEAEVESHSSPPPPNMPSESPSALADWNALVLTVPLEKGVVDLLLRAKKLVHQIRL